MVGIFGSGNCFICWWRRASREGVWWGTWLDSHAPVLQSHPRCILTHAAVKAQVVQRDCLDEECWQHPAFLGWACLGKSQPRPFSLRSLNFFVFSSESPSPCGFLSTLVQQPPYHRLGVYTLFPSALTMLWYPCTQCRSWATWLCHWLGRQPWKLGVRYGLPLKGAAWRREVAMLLTWCTVSGCMCVPEICRGLAKRGWCKRDVLRGAPTCSQL